MQNVSRYALGSLACLVCSVVLLVIVAIISGQDVGLGWMAAVIFLCWPAAAFSLLVGTVIGLIGTIASADWQFRLQAFFAGLFCGGSLIWFWVFYLRQ